jgi:molybdopterin-guanine dinucleotide biosynthesis protein B
MGSGMKVAGIVGWHNSGKTTLLVAVVQELVSRGHRVSTVKHAHHAFDVDTPGKDSWRHRAAGATEVMVGSEARWALMHELRGAPEPDLNALLARMSPVDLVLVEGFKAEQHDKIEVYRDGIGEPPIAYTDSQVVAVASDINLDRLAPGVTRLDVGDPGAVADFIERHWALRRPAAATQSPGRA